MLPSETVTWDAKATTLDQLFALSLVRCTRERPSERIKIKFFLA